MLGARLARIERKARTDFAVYAQDSAQLARGGSGPASQQ